MSPIPARTTCPYEDAVVLSFLDGEPADDVADLAIHLESCSHCMRALDHSRKVDSILAAQTSTTIEDRAASLLLASVLQDLDPEPVLEAAYEPRRSVLVRVAIAASIMLAACIWSWKAWAPAGASPAEVGPAEVGNGAPRISSGHGPSVATPRADVVRFVVARKVRLRPRRRMWSDAEIERAFAGAWIPGLLLGQVEQRARALLDGWIPRCARPTPWIAAPWVVFADGARRRPTLLGPRVEDVLLRRRLAAARWLVSSVREGVLRRAELEPVRRALVRARGLGRDALVALVRQNRALFGRYVREGRLLRRPELARAGFVVAAGVTAAGVAAAELVGAVGFREIKLRRLGALSMIVMDVCARQALLTADRESLAQLVALYAAVATRSKRRVFARSWFVGLDDTTRALVVELLERAAAASRHAGVERELRALLNALSAARDSQPGSDP